MIVLVDPNDSRAVRNKDNVLALYVSKLAHRHSKLIQRLSTARRQEPDDRHLTCLLRAGNGWQRKKAAGERNNK